MNERTWSRGIPLARVALAAIFLISGVGKLVGPAGAAGYIASKGLPWPMALAVGAGLLEVAGGLSVLVGLKARWGALALVGFLVPATLLFHNPVGLEGFEAQAAMIDALKNVAILGGLLLLAAVGPGPLSVDAKAAR